MWFGFIIVYWLKEKAFIADEENPMPRSLRKELQMKRTKKRIVFSSGNTLPLFLLDIDTIP